MSKKRKSIEFSHNENTVDDSDSLSQSADDRTNRAGLDSSIKDTTLQDLPTEMIEYILVKVVCMEVKEMKLAKSVWREKADLVMNRLQSVCSQWDSILTTKSFRSRLDRTLDDTVQEEALRMDILSQPPINEYVHQVICLNDDVFMTCKLHPHEIWGDCVVKVYDRSNMQTAKEVIQISAGYCWFMMAGCSVSNCVYVLKAEFYTTGHSVVRIRREGDRFRESPWITDLGISRFDDICSMSVSVVGNLLILSEQKSPNVIVVGIYETNRVWHHTMKLYEDIYHLSHATDAIQRSNGNIVLTCSEDEHDTKVLELDIKTGSIIHQYQSSLQVNGVTSYEDVYGRIMIHYPGSRIEVLDREYNLLGFVVPGLSHEEPAYGRCRVYYDGERHEMLVAESMWGPTLSVISIIRFARE